MNYISVVEKLVDKANFNMLRSCGLKPFMKNYSMVALFEYDAIWKALFGYSCSIDISIKQKDGSRLLLPAWKYYKGKLWNQ